MTVTHMARGALLTILIAPGLSAQVCFAPPGISWAVLPTQQAVNDFQAEYGPCNEVSAFLAIGGEDIVDLSPLNDLEVVGSDLLIVESPNLESLAGLDNLRLVGGSLTVAKDDLLSDLSGLSGLKEIHRYLSVFENNNLRSIDGLESLRTIRLGLLIESNPKLASVQELSHTRIGAEQSVEVRNGAIPVTQVVLRFLPPVGELRIASLHGFTGGVSFTAKQHIPPVDFARHGNLGFRAINSANGAVQEEHGSLWLRFNSSLPSLDGLQSIASAGVIDVSSNFSLTDCSALAKLLDVIDHGEPGPGPSEQSGAYHIPDVSETPHFESNGDGCNSVGDIAPEPVVERVLTGSWYSPQSAGEGFMIHAVREHIVNLFVRQTGLAVGYFYGYDEQGGRFWLIGVHEGDMQWDEPIEFTATRVIGSTFEDFDPAAVTETAWGSFSFTPRHCDAGVISLSGQFADQAPVQEKSLDVIRLGKVSGDYCAEQEPGDFSDSLTASWYDPATSGQGFAFHKIDDETGIVYFYGFDAAGAPLWLIGVWSGPVALGEPLEIPMIQVSGGTFAEVDPENIVEDLWGTLRLTMEDCLSGEAELDGLDGKQVLMIDQLASSLGLECPQ